VPGWPSFNLTEAELAVAFIRGLFVAALFSIFGVSLFRILIAPAAMKLARGAATTEIDRHYCLLIARWSTLIAALVMLAWLALESGMIADAETVEQALAAIPSVIWNTSFGHILAAQTLALLGTSIALMIDRRWSWFNAVAFAGIAVVLQAGHSHALAMHQEALLLSQCLHLLAAGPWLGGLLPLLLLVRETPSHGSAVAAQRFSTLGITCVVVLASTAAFQGWVLAAVSPAGPRRHAAGVRCPQLPSSSPGVGPPPCSCLETRTHWQHRSGDRIRVACCASRRSAVEPGAWNASARLVTLRSAFTA